LESLGVSGRGVCEAKAVPCLAISNAYFIVDSFVRVPYQAVVVASVFSSLTYQLGGCVVVLGVPTTSVVKFTAVRYATW